jgi:Shwachman-Bodian-Diamond syndrome (SBDS) protein
MCIIAFDVFHSVQGNQGKLGKASKQQLENTFGTSRDDDVVKFMLEKGNVHGASSEIGSNGGITDKSRCVAVSLPTCFSIMLSFTPKISQMIDTRGSGGGLRGHAGK